MRWSPLARDWSVCTASAAASAAACASSVGAAGCASSLVSCVSATIALTSALTGEVAGLERIESSVNSGFSPGSALSLMLSRTCFHAATKSRE